MKILSRNRNFLIWKIVFLLLISLTGVCHAAEPNSGLYVFDRSRIRVEGVITPFEASVDVKELDFQRYVASIYLHAAFAAAPPSFTLSVKFPRDKVNQLWNSKTWSNKSSFSLPSYDRAAAPFSIIAGLTINDRNQIAFTCKDVYKAKFVSSNTYEETDSIVFSLGFFEDNPPLSNLQDYQAEVLVDFRNIHFSQAIADASRWALDSEFKTSTFRVDTTNVPVFSTWYPMHRNIPLGNIARELDSLKTFNFKSVLVDDGLQALVNMKVDTTYSYGADSYETMSLFRKKCAEMHLPLYLWYSLPFIGGNPVVLEKFEGKYIRYRAPRQMYVLDPRYAEVRKYLVSTYANFLNDWKFDGYWFDFLKGFYPNEGQVIDDDLGRDFISIDLAVDTLYADMTRKLKSLNPNIFMGQKFQVVGPNLVSYQNFLTGFAGVENVQVVREKMVNNRLLYGKYTPFMEVVAITPADKTVDIARKMQAVLFGNPYLSFYVTTLPEESKQTIRFWLNYWRRNYATIFEGDFEPMQVARFYPVIKVENTGKTIYALYEDYIVNIPGNLGHTLDVINSKTDGTVSFMLSNTKAVYNYETYDCSGKLAEKGVLKSNNKKVVDLLVPAGGFVRVTSI